MAAWMMYSLCMKEIADAYKNIIGQSAIVQKRILSHSAFVNGCDASVSVLFTGEAGLGKSRLLEAEKQARATAVRLRYEREPWVYAIRSPQEVRLAGPSFAEFIQACNDGDGVIMDELHEVDLTSTVQLKKVKKILKDLMDGNQGDTRRCVIDDNCRITRDSADIFFAAGTNYPQQIKDGSAIISRFGGETPLELYKEDELTQILLLMAEGKGLRIHEDTIALIARCGRGTARPMEHIVKHLDQVAAVSGKRTINRAETLEAMKLLGLFPFGLTKREVSIMIRSGGAGVRLRDLPTHYAVEQKAVQQSLSFLCAHGFISLRNGLCEVSPRGTAYLGQLSKEKFSIPTI